jgi:hypothetical protein
MEISNVRLAGGKPTHVMVEMTIDEAAVMAMLTGRLAPSVPASTEIWDCLTDELFNRFWDGGIDEVPTKLDQMVSRLKWRPDAES